MQSNVQSKIWTRCGGLGLIGALVASNADAQSSNDAEIAALKQNLRLMEQKLEIGADKPPPVRQPP